MSKDHTQKQIMSDLIQGLNSRYSWLGWHFQEMKIKGLKHVIRGDNKERDLHCSFAVPMLLIQQANMNIYDAYDYKVYRPISEMMQKAKS